MCLLFSWCIVCVLFFFKQKTAYEMRISDWSSDVCSSDLLVYPVGSDAVFGHLVHVVGADLHLDAVALGPDDRRVQRAVAVRLGRRDEVLEAAGHHVIAAVQQAERMVAVTQRADDDTK